MSDLSALSNQVAPWSQLEWKLLQSAKSGVVMKGAQYAAAILFGWSFLATPCAAQSRQIIGFQSGGEPICAGPLGSGPCAPAQQSMLYGQDSVPPVPSQASVIAEAALRETVITSPDPRIRTLGAPIRIIFSAPVESQGLTLLNATIIHVYGSTGWRLGLLPSGSIAIQELAGIRSHQYNLNPPIGNHGQISGGYGSVINEYGSIFGQSDANNMRNPTFNMRNPPLQGHPGLSGAGIRPPREEVGPWSGVPDGGITPPPPLVDDRVVEFLIATTRRLASMNDATIASYSGERAALSFGVASVRIPEDHKIGRIELPSSWSLFGFTYAQTPNDRKHFIIKRTLPVTEDVFDQIIKNMNSRSALVFVHGFNNSFEDSVLRNAQILWDIQFRGVSVLFSWASRGGISDYIYDKESASVARDAFLRLIEKLHLDYGIEQINVLAHSMGNLLTLDALAGYAQTNNPVAISRLVMAAPDIDRDLFLKLAPKAKAIVGGMTLYASSTDKALAASRRLAGGIPRAGDVSTEGPVLVPGVVETIDVTAVGDDILGLNHNVFATSRDVMEDIAAMLHLNKPPPRLAQIRAVPEPPGQVKYWQYAPR